MAEIRTSPILLITGFLGSGKTTLLAQWLRSPALSGALAIVNEFGEVGIDDRLIQSSSEQTLLLENGCACCTAGEDLAATLERLFWQQLSREIPPISWVLIETTGVADPGPILDMLARHSLLAERYRIAGTVTMLDARSGPAQVAMHEECRHQVEQASLMVVTKTDLSNAQQMADAEAVIRRLSPHVPILKSAKASLPIEGVLELLAVPLEALPRVHRGHAAHDHDHHAHDHTATIDSAFLGLPDDVDIDRIAPALIQAQHRFGPALLRLKGIVMARGGLYGVQLDPGGGGVEVAALSPGASKAPLRPGFTIITRGVAAAEIAEWVAANTTNSGCARRVK
ncbi:GTP-binding protein [Caballeronia sp. dw_19]|uniref:CobW family GTP-binding protein n=1 Tax=Caballeronia sp. dw_19 TaxID=2719791 RepID=UPI001BD2DE05|nr:GTP-binding protein [Caballeronia sp. dw_19]